MTVATLRGGGQEYYYANTKALVLKSASMLGEGVKTIQNCVTSFLNDAWLLTGLDGLQIFNSNSSRKKIPSKFAKKRTQHKITHLFWTWAITGD